MSDAPSVRTRRVHYISGLDPRGARFYHSLYKEEAAKQAAVNGVSIETGDLESVSDHLRSWKVISNWKDLDVETDYQFLDWEDLMRENWGSLGSPFRWPAYLRYVLVESWRVARISRYFFHTTLGPLLYVLLLLVVLAIAAGSLFCAAATVSGSYTLAAASAGAAIALLLYGGWRYAKRVRIIWLFRVCTCVLGWGRKPWNRMEERIAEFARHIIAEQKRKPADEVLIVGHSIGAILAIHIAATILDTQEHAVPGMHLLTIGSNIPFLGVLPSAGAFRRDLAKVAGNASLPWTDFTAIKDILCFFKANPVEACGIRLEDSNRPRCVPMRIYRMFSKKSYTQMQRDYVRLHLQYLMASEVATEYDYFAITAGPLPLSRYSK